MAARARAKCKQKGQSLSPADKRDHPCCPLRPPPVARVPQQEGPAPEAQLHWAQPDRGTATGRAKGGGAPEYEGSGSAKASPLRRTAAEAALGWAQDLPRRAVSRAGSVPVLKLSRNWGRHSPLNDGAKGCRQSPLNDGTVRTPRHRMGETTWGRHLWSAPRRLAGMWGSEHRGQRPGHLPACQGQDPTRLPAATPHHRCRGRRQTVTAPASCSAPNPRFVLRWRGNPWRDDGWTSRVHCRRRT